MENEILEKGKNIIVSFSNDFNEIVSALSLLQGEVEQPALDGHVDVTFKSGRRVNYKYATLGEVQRCLKEPLKNHGIAVFQSIEMREEKFYLSTMIFHKSGQWIKGFSPILCAEQTDPKVFGGATTYARRYSLYTMFNLYGQEDLDAQDVDVKEEHVKFSVSSTCTLKQKQTIQKLIFQRGAIEDDVLTAYGKKLNKDVNKWEDFTSGEAGSIIEEMINKLKNNGGNSCSKIQSNG